MRYLNVADIRNMFTEAYFNNELNDEGMLELLGVSFIANESSIFGIPNEDYIKREIDWYNSMSLNVEDLVGTPKIWNDIADVNGKINSNYGWCIYSTDNGRQYDNVRYKLEENPNTRQATMIYTRPTMHLDAMENGRKDFMCTNAVTYRIQNGYLNCTVQMRSNDAVYGYKNDYAWQLHVLKRLANELDLRVGDIYWQVASLHVYPRHFHLLDQ